MVINKDVLFSYLLYNDPIKYTPRITLYPVTMKNIIDFQILQRSITIRKDSIFPEKNILKMSYLDFLFYCHNNFELAETYKMNELPYYYSYALELLKLVCRDQEVLINTNEGMFQINGEVIDSDAFDDLRRIIIIQNNIDFQIDEFVHYDAEQALLKARDLLNKDKSTIEDYIDAYAVATKSTDEEIANLTIRKFNRYIDRINMYDNYKIVSTASMSGMVTMKNPIKHWMSTINDKDQFDDVKTSEEEFGEIKGKIG